MHFHWKYFTATVILFIIEVLIALFVNDNFIRPYFGDVLVVMLIYCFIKTFFITDVITTAIVVLLFSYFIEMLQYYRFVEILGLADYKLARVVLGTSFAWHDIVAYTAGILIVIGVERMRGDGNINGNGNSNDSGNNNGNGNGNGKSNINDSGNGKIDVT